MRSSKFSELLLLTTIFSLILGSIELDSGKAQTEVPKITIMESSGQAVTSLVDGNSIRFKAENLEPADQTRKVTFMLDGQLLVGTCDVETGKTSCESEPANSLGWFWDAGGAAKSERQITLQVDDQVQPGAATEISVLPRPVVLVHGFISDYTAFNSYLGPHGFLARASLQGFAVGDGQAPGVMATGSIDAPQNKTNTIAQNAEILGQYVQGVKSLTGAEMVDLVVHSMGGMISRAYIDDHMQGRDIAQLIMLGSPMGGSDCSNLPAALGFYLPASVEIRPSYMRGIFNVQVTRRKGVQFYNLAGTPIVEGIKSPCTAPPNDLVVSLDSANAIPLQSAQMPVLHTELNLNEQVFYDFVLPKLQKQAAEFIDEPDSALSGQAVQPVQFSRLFTGQLKPGESTELTIPIDAGISVASFALYDSSRSLNVRVRGASGNEIELSAEQNGLTKIEDPAVLFYLGYGFNNPKPGAWVVRLEASGDTPTSGASYALAANFTGGAILEAEALPLIPEPGTFVTISSRLILAGNPLTITSAKASVREPDGRVIDIDLALNNGVFSAQWQPVDDGLHGIDLVVSGEDNNGQPIERSAFLAVQVLPAKPPTTLALLGLGLVLISVILLVVWLLLRFIRRRSGIKTRNS